VYVQGRQNQIIVGWITPTRAVTAAAYNPMFGAFRTHVIGHVYSDDHGSPALFVEPDNRITVFSSAHNGVVIYYRTTLHPEDISSWGPTGVSRRVAWGTTGSHIRIRCRSLPSVTGSTCSGAGGTGAPTTPPGRPPGNGHPSSA
jgi:hypothetical protein